MSIHSRNKGANAEREVRDIMRKHGFACERDGQLRGDGLPNEDLRHEIPGVHIEVKRRETLAIPSWVRQSEADAGPDRTSWLVYRQNHQPWRTVVDFEWLLDLMRDRLELEKIRRRTAPRVGESEAERIARLETDIVFGPDDDGEEACPQNPA